jgi:hypothetical protein
MIHLTGHYNLQHYTMKKNITMPDAIGLSTEYKSIFSSHNMYRAVKRLPGTFAIMAKYKRINYSSCYSWGHVNY